MVEKVSRPGALVRPRKAAELAVRIPAKPPPDTSKILMSPMPGLIVSIPVRADGAVKAGQDLLILEAMKMENVLRAERDGVTEAIRVEAGATVAADEVLITFGQGGSRFETAQSRPRTASLQCVERACVAASD